MKKIILLFSLVMIFNASFAQHFSITLLDNTDCTNSSVTYVVDPPEGYNVYNFLIVNNTQSAMTIGIRKEIIKLEKPSFCTFCAGGNCWGPDIELLPEDSRILVEPGSNITFDAEFNCYDTETWEPLATIIVVKYYFYSDEFPDDISTLTITYDSGKLGIANNEFEYVKSVVYPNPANDVVTLQYPSLKEVKDATLILYSLVGVKVKSIKVNSSLSDVFRFDISDLKAGVYMYSINSGDKVLSTGKITKK